MGQWRGSLEELVNPQSTAVLAVDMQHAFTSIPDLYPALSEMIPRFRLFLAAARAAGALVVNIRIVIPPNFYTENWQHQFTNDFKSEIGPSGSGIVFEPGFEPANDDVVITKHRYSGFYETSLTTILRTKAIRTVVVGGLTTDVCVGSTARDAYQQDFSVITLSDCTAEVTRQQHESALATFAMNFGMVCASLDIMKFWSRQRLSS